MVWRIPGFGNRGSSANFRREDYWARSGSHKNDSSSASLHGRYQHMKLVRDRPTKQVQPRSNRGHGGADHHRASTRNGRLHAGMLGAIRQGSHRTTGDGAAVRDEAGGTLGPATTERTSPKGARGVFSGLDLSRTTNPPKAARTRRRRQ